MRRLIIVAATAIVSGLLASAGWAQGMGSSGTTGGATDGTGDSGLKPVAGVRTKVSVEAVLDVLWLRVGGDAIANTEPTSSSIVSARGYSRLWENGMGIGLSVYVPFDVYEKDGTRQQASACLVASVLRTSFPSRSSTFAGVEREADDLDLLSYTIGGGLWSLVGGEDLPVHLLTTITFAIGGVQFNSVDLSHPTLGSEPFFDSTTGFAMDVRIRIGPGVQVTPQLTLSANLQLGYLFAFTPDAASPTPSGWSDFSPDAIFSVLWGFSIAAHYRF
jgi:hypothetical protein